MKQARSRQSTVLPLVLGLLLALAPGGPGLRSATAEEDPGLALAVEIGLGGARGLNEWTPVRVTAANAGADWQGLLVLTPDDYGERRRSTARALELPRGARRTYWFYLKLPSAGELHVRLKARRWRALDLALNGPVGQPMIAVLGEADWPTGVLENASAPAAWVIQLDAERMPDNWMGFRSLAWAVLPTAQVSAFGRLEAAEAFAGWVRAGGRAVVVAARGSTGVRGTILEGLLPAEVGELAETDRTEAIGRLADVPPPAAGRFAFSRLTAVRGDVLAREGELPLVVRGRVGLGEIILLAFDPAAGPFRRWTGSAALWRRLYQGDPVARSEAEELDAGVRANWRYYESPVVPLLESCVVREQVSFGLLTLLLLGYAFALGPGDWIVLRRLRRPGWMWITFVLWAALFGSGVYWLSMRGRAPDAALQRISLVDLDAESGWMAGRTYVGFYTPSSGAFDFLPQNGEGFVELHREARTWRNRNEARSLEGSGTFDASAGCALRDEWFWAAQMRHFEVEWRGGPELGFGVQARIEGTRLWVKNRGPARLENLVLATELGMFEGLGEVAPGAEAWLPLGTATPRAKWLEANQPWRYYQGSLPAVSDSATLLGRAWREVYRIALAPAGVTSFGEDTAGAGAFPTGRDLHTWVRAGGKLLLGSVARSPYRLQVAGASPVELDVCVLRVFFE
ncbi:MAG: hypothetical protein HZA54_07855 [Planctomycetes bacterium]|nr:hypothetical protein [Planctomycetota bacterium]